MTDKKPGRGVRPNSVEAIHMSVMSDIAKNPTVGWAFLIIGRHAEASDTRGAIAFGSYGDSFLGATIAGALLERNVKVAGERLDLYDMDAPDPDEGDDDAGD